MPTIKRTEFDRLIRDFQFAELFNRLGWDNASLKRPIKVDDATYPLTAVAEKSGFFVMHCETDTVPDKPIRRQINTMFSKVKDFHLIIYSDKTRGEQCWQFVLRAPNRPAKNIEVGWKKGQDTEALWQRTQGLFFSLDEEDNITIVDVTTRVTEAFGVNAEKVTRKFYETFKTEHRQFLAFIQGISTQMDREWYASLMLNRLMFCYFIQKKGFLDNNLNYLSDKLAQTRERRGSNQFYSFYRDFLLVLFHQGLNEPHQKPETRAEIGQVPYLNGGLFDVHELEEKYTIQIPDDAFEKIFRFFDQWEWHLDTRPNASAKEINPDVIGFIFEKYINDRADMGAYYTKEDITDYISKNCIIPFLFDQTERNGSRLAPCWSLAKGSGDRYIFPSVRHGISWDYRKNEPLDQPLPLPANIEAGLDTTKPGLVERRKAWNREAPPEYGLPTEWWREVVERRQRYAELRRKIDGGEVQTINDFITLNLDIRTFAQDCLQQTDDPDFLWTFYRALRSVSVLDPTCGSGAFLFAALNILEPLYEACLDRMAAFVEAGTSKNSKNFQEVLAEAADTARHPSREYYIYKKIIVHNLYGVDLMREAVEIAKLRLFLKLMSTVQPDRRKPNLGLEPLPDVDFNLRAGNTLVGFATLEETIEAINQRDLPSGAQSRLVFGEELEVIAAVRDKAELIGMAYKRFKDSQLLTNDGSASLKKAKDELNRRLHDLSTTLDEYLAFQYGINAAKDKQKFKDWKTSHTPFHWWAEFYEVLYDEEGRFKGFDVVIGNPPYVEVNSIKSYSILSLSFNTGGNLHSIVAARTLVISKKSSSIGFIVPVAISNTDRMSQIRRNLIDRGCIWVSNYAIRPGKLFSGAEQRLSIYISRSQGKDIVNNMNLWSSKYYKWNKEERNHLFSAINYTGTNIKNEQVWPKLSNKVSSVILSKIYNCKLIVNNFVGGNNPVYYKNTGVGYFITATLEPPVCFINGEKTSSSRETTICFEDEKNQKTFHAVFLSSTFFLYYHAFSNCRDLNPSDLLNFKLPGSIIRDQRLAILSSRLHADLINNSWFQVRNQKQTGEVRIQSFTINLSKPIIDEIDTVLAEHYGFTEEELDFIINYDIKYRMGRGSGDEE